MPSRAHIDEVEAYELPALPDNHPHASTSDRVMDDDDEREMDEAARLLKEFKSDEEGKQGEEVTFGLDEAVADDEIVGKGTAIESLIARVRARRSGRTAIAAQTSRGAKVSETS